MTDVLNKTTGQYLRSVDQLDSLLPALDVQGVTQTFLNKVDNY